MILGNQVSGMVILGNSEAHKHMKEGRGVKASTRVWFGDLPALSGPLLEEFPYPLHWN
jgi:hypothetical protein